MKLNQFHMRKEEEEIVERGDVVGPDQGTNYFFFKGGWQLQFFPF